MARYIDADALKLNWLFCGKDGKPYRDTIDAQPSADIVEVVRCKDCKYYEIWELKKDGTDDRRYKPKVCVLHAHLHDKNWYCADAIRKEGDAT